VPFATSGLFALPPIVLTAISNVSGTAIAKGDSPVYVDPDSAVAPTRCSCCAFQGGHRWGEGTFVIPSGPAPSCPGLYGLGATVYAGGQALATTEKGGCWRVCYSLISCTARYKPATGNECCCNESPMCPAVAHCPNCCCYGGAFGPGGMIHWDTTTCDCDEDCYKGCMGVCLSRDGLNIAVTAMALCVPLCMRLFGVPIPGIPGFPGPELPKPEPPGYPPIVKPEPPLRPPGWGHRRPPPHPALPSPRPPYRPRRREDMSVHTAALQYRLDQSLGSLPPGPWQSAILTVPAIGLVCLGACLAIAAALAFAHCSEKCREECCL
jgi:hypothetical protein